MVSKLVVYLNIDGVYWGYNALTNLFSNFLGHPSNPENSGKWIQFAD